MCSESDTLHVYICRKESFEGDEEAIGAFLDNIIKTNYENYESEQISIEEESMDSPS